MLGVGYNAVKVVDHFWFAMLFLLQVLMCFREKLEESKIREVAEMQKLLTGNGHKLQ